ncbi:MAG: hypothetical protein R3F36_01535 [Candidatus Competibacteraceae bacterium]
MNKPLLLLLSSLLSVAPAWADGDWDRARTARTRRLRRRVARPPLAEKGFAFAQFNLGVLYDTAKACRKTTRKR